MQGILADAVIYLLAAVIAVPICVRFGLGSVLGYLLAGIIIGPVLGIVGAETQDLQHIAEFGVVMMLFLIGLELDPRALWGMRARLAGLGGLQISITMGVVTAAAMALDLEWSVALSIGMIFALSSTAIVLQTFTEKGLMRTTGGRSGFTVLLAQDIAVIPMLAFIPLLALPGLHNAASGDHGGGHGDEGPVMHLIDSLPAWGVTLVTIGAVVAVVLGGHYLTRPIFRFIHMAKLREMYTAVSLLFVVGVAALMLTVGLSPALGTFLAGVVLANSEFRHELEADIEPFKGLLLGLFFITVGAGINFGVFMSAPVTIIGLTFGLITVKGLILYGLAMAARLPRKDRLLFALSLAQAGEFGFVLTSFSVQQNAVPAELGQALLLVIAFSMLLTPVLFIVYEHVSKSLVDPTPTTPHDDIDEKQPVIIAGIGRFGQVVNRMMQMAQVRTVVLDNDLSTIKLMRRFGVKGFFGDPTRPELLHAAGFEQAKVLVVAMDDPKEAIKLVEYARRERPDLHIVARAYDRVHTYALYRAGADDIVREMFDSSLRAGRYVLENMGYTEYEANEAEQAFFKHDRHALLELAKLWNPDLPLAENDAYVARARDLNKDLETALLRHETGEDITDAEDAPDAAPSQPGSG